MTPWPTLDEYAVHARCSVCRALPGVECSTVRRRFHTARLDAGRRRWLRDVARAPDLAKRVPGWRYDSLPFATVFDWPPGGPVLVEWEGS